MSEVIEVVVEGQTVKVEVTDIFFSTRQEFVSNNPEGLPSAGGKRTTYLVAHISFKYLNNELGCVDIDAHKLTEVEYDSDGRLISFSSEDIPEDLKSAKSIVSKFTNLITTHIISETYRRREEAFISKSLAEVRSVEVPDRYSHFDISLIQP